MNQFDAASQILNSVAPQGERLAYLNPYEEALLMQLGGSGQPHAGGIPSYNWVQDRIDDVRGKTKRNAIKAQQEAQQRAMDEAEAKQIRLQEEARDRDNASMLISSGKMGFTDLNDAEGVASALKEMEGEYLDPFAEYTRKTGDLILNNLEDSAEAAETYMGTGVDRMEGFRDTFNQADTMMDRSMSELSDIFDPNGMQARMEASNNELNSVLDELKGINTATAARERELYDNYGSALGDSVGTQVDYANREFDARRAASDAQLAGEQAMAASRRRNASLGAGAGMRALNSAGGMNSTGSRMANMMMNADMGMRQSDALGQALVDEAVRRGQIEGDRLSKIGEINPGMADVYRNEVALKAGTPELDAAAMNLGIDESQIKNREALADEIMNRRLSNVDAISGLASNKALLPGLFGEAALAPMGAFERKVSPFTATGNLSPGQTIFNQTPYVPSTSGGGEGGGIDWLGTLQKAPDILNAAKGIFS